ncbi:hypothetical protein FA15DRAFT_604529, partial [Coprinopsis marcescibilis]
VFGTDGVILAADNHSCSECTHAYNTTSDILDGEPVPIKVDNAGLVNIAVVDGVVFGPTHCTFKGYTAALDKYSGASFCTAHKAEWGNMSCYGL